MWGGMVKNFRIVVVRKGKRWYIVMVSILGEVGFLKEKEGEVFGSNSEDGEGYLFYF